MLASLAVAGQPLSLPERITVKQAIELAGLSFGAGRVRYTVTNSIRRFQNEKA